MRKNMERIGLKSKELVSYIVGYDCCSKYHIGGKFTYVEKLIETTKNYLVEEFCKKNPKYNNSVLECSYNPTNRTFTIYELSPYLYEDKTIEFGSLVNTTLGDLEALNALRKKMEESI